MNFLQGSFGKRNPKEDIDKKFRVESHLRDIWTVLHTTSVYLPESLNENEEKDYTQFVEGILQFATKADDELHNYAKLYRSQNKYNFKTRENAALYLCNFHNSYNLVKEKYLFECTVDNLAKRYGNASAVTEHVKSASL